MSDANAWMQGRRAVIGALAVVLTTVGGLVATPGAASAATFSSFSAGVFAPNQIRHVWWNNANSDAYAPGLQVVGADDPGVICDLQVLRSWYQRNASGEREFHLEIKGDKAERCRATVWLARLSRFRESSTGELAAGQSRSWIWNNAHTDQNVFVVGVLPAQPASGACAIEVTTQYRTQPTGENEFLYKATNVGDVACSATLRHVELGVDSTFPMTPVSAGGRFNIWADLMPADTRVVVAGGAPDTTSAGVCQISIGSMSYFGPPPRSWGVHNAYRNTGSVSCGVTATFAVLR